MTQNKQKESELEQKILTIFTGFVIFLGGIGLLVNPPKSCSQQTKDKKAPINSKIIKIKHPTNSRTHE